MLVERIIFHSSFDIFHLPFRKTLSLDSGLARSAHREKSPFLNGLDVPNAK
jgi:hypothetical protein